MSEKKQRPFVPLGIAVMTVSDSRTEETDTSGQYLAESIVAAGHHVAEKQIVIDDIYQVRALVSRWIVDPGVQAIIGTGGTGLTGRDITPEALLPLLDKEIEGFGELFRWVSWQEIGTSTLASRAFAGVSNGTTIFCLPGSTGACRTGWEQVIAPQMDNRTTPCSMVELMPRMTEK